jgi:alpha-ribazole phosphatase
MEIILIRHTNVDVGPEICYGKSDVALAKSFDAERLTVESKLSKELLERPRPVFYSSALTRSIRLAAFLSKNSKTTYEARINEIDFGRWEMTRWNEIDRTEFDAWAEDYVNSRPPGGESFYELCARAWDFFLEMISKPNKKNCVVTHAGVIRSIICRCLNIPLKNAFNISVDFGSVTKINYDKCPGLFKIEFINR